jgi:hypothetical protein
MRQLLRPSLGLAAICLAAPACSTTAVYGGSRRPNHQVAVIDTGARTEVVGIDDVAVNGGAYAKYEVLPGKHKLVVTGHRAEWKVFWTEYITSSPLSTCFMARAGRTYVVRVNEEEDRWRATIRDTTTGDSVEVACSRTISPAAVAAAERAIANSRSRAYLAQMSEEADLPPPTDASPEPPAVQQGASPTTAEAPPPVRRPGPERIAPRPGSGLHLAFGGAFGGDDLLKARFSNGQEKTISGGSGLSASLGGTVTPLWTESSVGFGFGGNLGWKADWVSGKNGSVTLSRVPLLVWLHTLLPISESWFGNLAMGGQKELAPRLSGEKDFSETRTEFESPWGWFAELGLYWAENWHQAIGFGLRYTRASYRAAGSTIDASSLGLNLTLHLNP